MSNFWTKDEYTFEDIESLINNNAEESINLDFKASGALAKEDKKKMEVAKDVSAFANSDGGLIVYGIAEKNHKADSLSFIDGAEFTKEWIDQVINTGIQRHIEGLRIYPVRKDGDIKKSIYVVKIPYSFNTPHISKDKKYYKRYNFESVPMEEYEVRQLYNRKSKSELYFAGYSVNKIESNNDEVTFRLMVDIINTGQVVETLYKVNLYVDMQTAVGCEMKFTWDKYIDYNDYQIFDFGESAKVSCKGRFPIFPDEKINAMTIRLVMKRNEVINESTFTLKLLYSNGIDEITIDSTKFDINKM